MTREFESKFRGCVGARNTENPLLIGATERTLGPGGPGLGACPGWGAWPRTAGKQELRSSRDGGQGGGKREGRGSGRDKNAAF